jgi:hypothetical protein
MNCNDISEKIPAIIKREVISADRILYLDHVKTCDNCRTEYQKYLKLFYTLELQAAQPEPQLADIKIEIPDLTPNITPRRIKYWWPVAASFLVLLLSVIILINQYPEPSGPVADQNQNIREQLVGENWIGLSKLVNDKSALAKNADQTIPVNILLNKLRQLEQEGISKISLAGNQDDSRYKEVELQYFIDQLERYKKFKSALSVREISDFLYVI